jgi:hypothetical protein
VPGETAIASILASSLWALQTRSWRQPASHVRDRFSCPLTRQTKHHIGRSTREGVGDRYGTAWLEHGQERTEFTLHERIKQVRRPVNAEERKDPFAAGNGGRSVCPAGDSCSRSRPGSAAKSPTNGLIKTTRRSSKRSVRSQRC